MSEKSLLPRTTLQYYSFGQSTEQQELFDLDNQTESPTYLNSHNGPNKFSILSLGSKDLSLTQKASSNNITLNKEKEMTPIKQQEPKQIINNRYTQLSYDTSHMPVWQPPRSSLIKDKSAPLQNSSRSHDEFASNRKQEQKNLSAQVAAGMNVYRSDNRGKLKENSFDRKKEDSRKSKDLKESYKNFEIIHNVNPRILDTIEAGGETNKQNEGIDNEKEERRTQDQAKEEQVIDKEVQKRVFLKNPGISSLISESSLKLYKINKMLEEHRLKKNGQTKSLLQQTIETLKIDPIQRQSFNEIENIQIENCSAHAFDNKKKSKDSVELANNALSPKEEKMKEEKEEQTENVEKIDQNKKQEKGLEWSVMDEAGSQTSENEEEKKKEPKKKEIKKEELQLGRLEERKSVNGLNQSQRELASARVNILKERILTEPNKQKLADKSNCSSQVRGNSKHQSKPGKENIGPNIQRREVSRKASQKQNTSAFLSIDLSHQQDAIDLKRGEKDITQKNKGSYLKIFLDYKERRKQKNPDHSEKGRKKIETPYKSYKSSRSSNTSVPMRDTISDRLSSGRLRESTEEDHKKKVRMIGNTDLSTAVESNDLNGLSDKSLFQGMLSTPSSRQNPRPINSDKNPKDTKHFQHLEDRVIKSEQRKSIPPNPLAEQLAKLQLNFSKGHKQDETDFLLMSQSQKSNSQRINAEQRTKSSNQEISNNLSSKLLKPRGVEPQSQISKAPVQTSREPSNNGRLELRELLKPKEDVRRNLMEVNKAYLLDQDCIVKEEANMNSQCIQDSLMRSIKLRQEICSRMQEKGGRQANTHNQSQKRDGGIERGDGYVNNGQTKKQDMPKISIYSKNVEWMMSKQKKLDQMHTKEIEDEMRECTFKPQFLAKELKIKMETHRDRDNSKLLGSFASKN